MAEERTNFDRAVEEMKGQICNLIDSHKDEMEAALRDMDGLKGISIGLGGRIAPKEENTDDLTVKTRIAFVPEKITDSMEETITNQQSLPGMEQPKEKVSKSSAEILAGK